MRHYWLIITLVALVLGGCTPTPETGQSPSTTTSPSTSTPGQPGTADPSASPQDQPAAAGPATRLSAWKLLDPINSDMPTIVEQGEQGYRIRSDWQVESIKYRYEWVGFSDTTIDERQMIQRTEQGFEREGIAVDAKDVQAFVQALDHLYPAQSMLAGQSHTDDYPEWNIVMAGIDGVQVEIRSISTGNPNSGPWNVVINGQRFVQYDGALVKPLAQLFKGSQGIEAINEPVHAEFQDGRTRFGTLGFPDGGYEWNTRADGLALDYTANPQEQAISGNLFLETSLLNARLQQIELKLPDESTAICAMADNERVSHSRYFATKRFHCPVAEIVSGLDYTYALFMTFADQPPAIIRLVGTWGQPFDAALRPAPLEFTQASATNANVQDLLTDHILLHLNYSAEMDPNQPLKATLGGDALLIGQIEANNQMVRYSIESPFIITDGILTHWDLDRASLSSLRDEILALELTKRVLAADPRTIINLRYVGSLMGEVPGSGLRERPEWEIEILPCGAIAAGKFPTADQPLQGFSYNRTFAAWGRSMEFVLINGQPVVANLDLFGPYDQRYKGAVQQILTPEGLDTGSRPPFDRIAQTASSSWGEAPVLTIDLPDPANEEDPAIIDPASYERQLNDLKLPFTHNTYGPWEAKGVTIEVGQDGILRLVKCS